MSIHDIRLTSASNSSFFSTTACDRLLVGPHLPVGSSWVSVLLDAIKYTTTFYLNNCVDHASILAGLASASDQTRPGSLDK